MRNLLILLTLSFLASCGLPLHEQKSSGSRQYSTSNSVFSSYVQKFEAEAKKELGRDFSVGDIPINFGDPEEDAFDGVCIKYSNGQREILIRKDWWDNRGETSKEMMIFHELGHCKLDRSHDNTTVEDDRQHQVKLSVMNSVLPSVYDYVKYKAGYVSELFHSEKEHVNTLVSK